MVSMKPHKVWGLSHLRLSGQKGERSFEDLVCGFSQARGTSGCLERPDFQALPKSNCQAVYQSEDYATAIFLKVENWHAHLAG